jgi:hypothetical protein
MEEPGMVWIICDNNETSVEPVSIDGDNLWLSADAVHRATGWQMKPEGLCRDDVCVPVPPGRAPEFLAGDTINISAFWRHMDRPVSHDADGQAWLLAPGASDQASALESLEAPNFSLPDLSGQMHSLAQHRGKKVLLATWASW